MISCLNSKLLRVQNVESLDVLTTIGALRPESSSKAEKPDFPPRLSKLTQSSNTMVCEDFVPFGFRVVDEVTSPVTSPYTR